MCVHDADTFWCLHSAKQVKNYNLFTNKLVAYQYLFKSYPENSRFSLAFMVTQLVSLSKERASLLSLNRN